MIGRFWPLLVIAFLVGSLFRLYAETGIGFYRMFGTMGIVVLGAVASRIIVTEQLGEGERLLKAAISALPADCDVWRMGRRGLDRIVVGPGGAVVLAASNVAHYARGWGLQRGLRQLEARLDRMTAVAQDKLQEVLGDETPIHRAVVFLRREVRPEDRRWLQERGIDAMGVDEVFDYLAERTVTGVAAPPETEEVVPDPAFCYTGDDPSPRRGNGLCSPRVRT